MAVEIQMVDVFQEARRLVSAREVAELNGLHPNRRGFICCPLHHEKTASLKLYDDGHWHCFGCNRGGSSIDLMAALYDLTPLDAVRRLDSDFHLNLPLDKPPDTATVVAAQHRQEVRQTFEMFEQWRGDMLQQLTACFREGHLALQSLETPADLDKLTDAQALAIREQARFEWLADVLTSGDMKQMMDVFRQREGVGRLCNRVLKNLPTRSSAA